MSERLEADTFDVEIIKPNNSITKQATSERLIDDEFDVEVIGPVNKGWAETVLKEFDEALHPRDEKGRFTGGGGDSTPVGTKYDTPEIIATRNMIAEKMASGEWQDTSTINTPERLQLRSDTSDKLFNQVTATAEKGKEVHIVIGMPSAGKSSALVDGLAERTHSAIADSDDVKKMLPEYRNGVGATLVHKESCIIIDDVKERIAKSGYNAVLPMVGSTAAPILANAQLFKNAGYKVHLHLVDVDPEVGVQRAISRWKETNRFVDPSYIVHDVDSRPPKVYNRLKTNSMFSLYSKWDNNGSKERGAKLIESKTK